MNREQLRMRLVNQIDSILNRPLFNWVSTEDRNILLAMRQVVNQDDGQVLEKIISYMGPSYNQRSQESQGEDMTDKKKAPAGSKGTPGNGGQELPKGVTPDVILAYILVFGEYAPQIIEMLKKMADLWKKQPRTAASQMVHCPAGDQCCDALIENISHSLCLALHCKKCCAGPPDEEEQVEDED